MNVTRRQKQRGRVGEAWGAQIVEVEVVFGGVVAKCVSVEAADDQDRI